MKLRVALSIGLTGLIGLAATGCVSAGSTDGGAFPEKNIHVSVPWAAGGGGDLNARTLAPILEEKLGVEVIIENRPGASGSVGMKWLETQPSDGYNVSFVGAELASLQHLGYDITPKSFAPIAQIISVDCAIAVPANSEYKTLQDLIDAAKKAPGKVSYSNPGPGSIYEGTGIGFQNAAGIELASVPFDGSAPAVTAAVGGQVNVVIDNVGNIGPQVDSGALRYLAVFTDERREDLADVPTAKEQGVELVNASWNGIVAPNETPKEVVTALTTAFEEALSDQRFVEHSKKTLQDVTYRNPEEMGTYLEEQADLYGKWFAKS